MKEYIKKHREKYKEKFYALNPGFGDSERRNHLGAAHELIVCGYLLKKGFDVFRSVSPACQCDLVVIKNEKMLKVEVKTGYYEVSGRKSYSTLRNHGKFDILAVVYADGLVEFSPPISEL